MKLVDILSEITLGGVKPYQTRFAWHKLNQSTPDDMPDYETRFEAEPGYQVTFIMSYEVEIDPESPVPQEESGYSFTFVTPTRDPRGFSISHADSAGGVNYLRLMSTVAEAIKDFCAQYAPSSVNLSAADKNAAREIQKERIYKGFIRAAGSQILQLGYRVMTNHRGGIWLVRKTEADSTGIRDTK